MECGKTNEMDNSNAKWEFTNDPDITQKNSHERKVHTPSSRKIRPIQNPALKLKTPIAYQRDSDPNMLPIEKEGRGKNSQQLIYKY